MANLERKNRYNQVYIDKNINYIKKLKIIKKDLNLNTYQYDVVYKYINERFSHASARNYLKGMPVKDIVPSQKEAEKIYAVIEMFIRDNQIRLNELICD